MSTCFGVVIFVDVPLAAALPFEYTIAGWLVDSEVSKAALEGIKKTHRVNYLEAYDVKSDLIHPLRYRQCLQGAVIQVHFQMTHWAFPARNGVAACDTFVADIVSMRVLVPLSIPKAPSTPKRKFMRKDPLTPDITPKKFRTFTTPLCKLLYDPFQSR